MKKTETNFKCYRRWRKTFYDLGNVHVCNNGISGIHGKELPEQLSLHCNTTDLTFKQIFDISTKVVSEQDEISGLDTIGWENQSWKYLSLIVDERIINLQRTKVYVFSYSVLCLGRIFENLESNEAWEQRLGGTKCSQSYRTIDRIDGEPMEFEWNIFPGFNIFQLCDRISDLLSSIGQTPETFTGRILFMSMFNDISCDMAGGLRPAGGWLRPAGCYRRAAAPGVLCARRVVSPVEFEWNIFPGFNILQLYGKVTDLLSRSRETQEKFTGRILVMSMFNDISWGSEDNKKECESNANLVSQNAKRFGKRTMVIFRSWF